MKLKQLFEKNSKPVLAKSEFCADRGAGALILASSTGKLLVSHRSAKVHQPNTWGIWGGGLNKDETPIAGANREVIEELGVITLLETIPLYVFHDSNSGFKYFNFLFVVEKEFSPSPLPGSEWETKGHKWVKFGEWPSPMHFGLKALVEDSASEKAILKAIKKHS